MKDTLSESIRSLRVLMGQNAKLCIGLAVSVPILYGTTKTAMALIEGRSLRIKARHLPVEDQTLIEVIDLDNSKLKDFESEIYIFI